MSHCIIFAIHHNTIETKVAKVTMETITRKQLSLRLREDLIKSLQEQARKENRSLNNFIENTLMSAVCLKPAPDLSKEELNKEGQ